MSRQDKPHSQESIEKMRASSKIANENLSEESRQRRIEGGRKPKPDSMKQSVSKRMKTSENPWYIDGRCSGENQPYSEDWKESLKAQIRDRDEHVCRLCDKTEAQNSKSLDVHHLDYNKENCAWINLISLCMNCHRKTNPKKVRDDYQSKLSNLLLSDLDPIFRFIGRQEIGIENEPIHAAA